MTNLDQYLLMLREVKQAKEKNQRNYWQLHDQAADFYKKHLKGTADGKKAALERMAIL